MFWFVFIDYIFTSEATTCCVWLSSAELAACLPHTVRIHTRKVRVATMTSHGWLAQNSPWFRKTCKKKDFIVKIYIVENNNFVSHTMLIIQIQYYMNTSWIHRNINKKFFSILERTINMIYWIKIAMSKILTKAFMKKKSQGS